MNKSLTVLSSTLSLFSVALIAVATILLIPAIARAQTPKYLLENIPCAQERFAECQLCDFVELVINAADILVALSGIFGIIMFVYGGAKMILAYGKADQVDASKNTLLATVTGIVIVMLAWTLVNVIILTAYGGDTGAFTDITGKSTWSGPCAGGQWQGVPYQYSEQIPQNRAGDPNDPNFVGPRQ